MRSPRKSFKLPKPQRQDVCVEPPQEAQTTLGIITGLSSLADEPTCTLRELVDHAGELLPNERVARCGKIFRRGEFTTTAQYNTETKRARLTNMCMCGSPWSCPVCAIQRAMKDKRELAWACSDPRYTPILVTYTASHHADDTLEVWDKKFNDVCEGMKSGKFWEKVVDTYGVEHTVWRKEYTVSEENGWHPHRHTIFFLRGKVDVQTIKRLEMTLRRQYETVLRRHGLGAVWEHGVKVSAKEHDITEYIAKYGRMPKYMEWDIEHEVAHSSIKEGHKDGKTPFELLGESFFGDEESGKLFVEYAVYVKGKKPLNWSKGAKADLLQGDRPLLKEPPAPGATAWVDVVTISRTEFDVLVQLKLVDALLSIVMRSTGNSGVVRVWLDTKLKGHVVNINDLMWTEYERTYGMLRP